jgi:hypothetical protein
MARITQFQTLLSGRPVDRRTDCQQRVPLELNSRELGLCGFGATVFGDIVSHPLETIKTMQQSVGQYCRRFHVHKLNASLSFTDRLPKDYIGRT